MFTDIIEVRNDGILSIGINRPSRKNAMTDTMYQQLAKILTEANENSDVQVVLLHGSEDAFSSGNDIEDFVQRPASENLSRSSEFMKALLDLKKPIIAAVNGPAVGIGATLLLHCDLVYAGTSAYISFPFTKLGLCAEFASSIALAHIVGYRRATEMLLLGERCSAQRAEQLGLVNEVLPPDQVLPKAITVGKTLVGMSQSAVRTTRSLMRMRNSELYEQHRHIELEQFANLLQSPEAQNAFQMFLTRR